MTVLPCPTKLHLSAHPQQKSVEGDPRRGATVEFGLTVIFSNLTNLVRIPPTAVTIGQSAEATPGAGRMVSQVFLVSVVSENEDVP